jgi:hypothetical protein
MPCAHQKREYLTQTSGMRKSGSRVMLIAHRPLGCPQRKRRESLSKHLSEHFERYSTSLSLRLKHYPIIPMIRRWMMTITMQMMRSQRELETLPQSRTVIRSTLGMKCGGFWTSVTDAMNNTKLTTRRLHRRLCARRPLRLWSAAGPQERHRTAKQSSKLHRQSPSSHHDGHTRLRCSKGTLL